MEKYRALTQSEIRDLIDNVLTFNWDVDEEELSEMYSEADLYFMFTRRREEPTQHALALTLARLASGMKPGDAQWTLEDTQNLEYAQFQLQEE